MLPELLFNVGNSMQDISRDDFSLLSGSTSGVGIACDKDHHISRTGSPIPSTPPASISDSNYPNCTDIAAVPVSSSFSPGLDRVNIKIEESCTDIYESTSSPTSWHHPHHHHSVDIGSTKLLLKNSDDPLISRGANAVEGDDDNPNELNSIVAAAVRAVKQRVMPPSEGHHKADVPMQSKKNKNASNAGPRTRRKGAFKLRFHHQALPAEYLSHYEASLNQQQNKVAHNNNSHNVNNNNNSKKLLDQENTKMQSSSSHETVRSWLEQISETQSLHTAAETRAEGQDDVITTTPVAAQRSPKRVVSYLDLPYMGEMTLENTKPRRGRKPKKADICHLIFKNYGTIFPGTPKNIVEEETKGLLEKRLKEQSVQRSSSAQNAEQPLNLCMRDLSTDSLTISSDDESSDDLNQSNRTTPNVSSCDAVTDAILAANLKMSLPNFQSALLDKAADANQTPSTGDSDKTSSNYAYWPTPGNVFIHPMALYYQKMMDAGFQSPAPPQTPPPLMKKPEGGSPKIFPKHLSQLIKKEKTEPPEPCSTPSSIKSNSSSTTATTGSTHNHGSMAPQKRKRSAIFIPPIPAENTSNPATEVSICKFKFTGGAKPSLQEKKMLSVDSDGNYRYYSGTGDKSMRGYEFFPRESLQQSGLFPGSNSSAAFLNATGEKISHDIPPPSVGLSNELLQLPDSPPGGLILPTPQNSLISHNFKMRHSGSSGLGVPASGSSASQLAKEKRKRKSRRSLQREKLEQTFKEKGFLIQTQQLESAEGATYCKFRQLRKFTRYLFRSWKDHLPGELQHANAANAAMSATSGKQSLPLQKNLMAAPSATSQLTDKVRRS